MMNNVQNIVDQVQSEKAQVSETTAVSQPEGAYVETFPAAEQEGPKILDTPVVEQQGPGVLVFPKAEQEPTILVFPHVEPAKPQIESFPEERPKELGDMILWSSGYGVADLKIGGAYKDVPANGGQVHHMPADSISPYSKGKGPGVRMETRDHMDTASWGSSKKAKQYRQKQKELIERGKFREAQQMDIDDVRLKFNDKYDDAIEQMKKYTDELLNKNK